MTRTKMALIAGALTIASTGAFAQTMGATAGVNFGTPGYQAYQQHRTYRVQTSGTDSYASADRVRRPISHAAPSLWRIDPRAEGAGYVTGGGVSLR